MKLNKIQLSAVKLEPEGKWIFPKIPEFHIMRGRPMRGSPMVNGEQLVYTFAISKIPSDSEIIF